MSNSFVVAIVFRKTAAIVYRDAKARGGGGKFWNILE
jgi:hypothetical protein